MARDSKKQDGIHSQGPTPPLPTAFSVPVCFQRRYPGASNRLPNIKAHNPCHMTMGMLDRQVNVGVLF